MDVANDGINRRPQIHPCGSPSCPSQRIFCERSRTQWVIVSLLLLGGCHGSDLTEYHLPQKSAKADRANRAANTGETSEKIRTTDEGQDTIPKALHASGSPVVESSAVSAIRPSNWRGDFKTQLQPPAVKVSPVLHSFENAIPPSLATPLNGEFAVPQGKILIPDKSFRIDGNTKALRVTYDDLDLLKIINLEPVTATAVDQMPKWLKELSGQRIRIRGFMYPTFEAEGIERFVLARDNQICCFGRDPKVYDLIQVDMSRGRTTNYIPATRAFDVVGRFKIEMVADEGKPFGLYFLEESEVIDR